MRIIKCLRLTVFHITSFLLIETSFTNKLLETPFEFILPNFASIKNVKR